MNIPSTPRVISFLPATMFLTITGWGGLFALLIYTQPTVWPRWLFVFFGVIAITGTALPVVAFLNRRFPTVPPASAGVVVREALWFGVYFATIIWLIIPRVLTVTLAVLLALALFLIEWLLRLRERSQWRP
jgi:hypothetical protein